MSIDGAAAPAAPTVPPRTRVPEAIPENCYRSELTNEWIDKGLANQRPIAVMIDNEKAALPQYGVTEADIVYELMNSTANNRITRFMAIVKDWGSLTQLGGVRSARPTNFMLAAEWDAVLCHEGGPFYIDSWVSKNYTSNLNGGFARFSNNRATEFSEYLTYDTYTNPVTGKSYDGLKQRFEKAKYSTAYTQYYPGPHFHFARGEVGLAGRKDAFDGSAIDLPFPHNQSALRYNDRTNTYDYYEYGTINLDALHQAPLTFTNVILQNTKYEVLDSEGYLVYNAVDAGGREGYYFTEGKGIEITWKKFSESGLTVYYDKTTGAEIEMNTGKTYIALIPSDVWAKIKSP